MVTATNSVRTLHRSRDDRMVAGVCGGLGEYLGIDSTVVRLAMVLLGLLSGVGVILYLVAWIMVPQDAPSLPPQQATGPSPHQAGPDFTAES